MSMKSHGYISHQIALYQFYTNYYFVQKKEEIRKVFPSP